MESIQIQLRREYIRLCDLLKLAGIADSGAGGKHLVAEGQVSVDGLRESRKTAKIRRAEGGTPRHASDRNGGEIMPA